MEKGLLALELCLHGEDDGFETRLKNGSFSPQIGPLRGTTACSMPDCTPIFQNLISQSLGKNNGPHCKHLVGTTTIVLTFQDDRPKTIPKRAILGHSVSHRMS